jgi:hypothetical protein
MARIKYLANVNVGTSANDGTGDLLRVAFIKVNENYNTIYFNGQFVSYFQDTKLTPGYSWSSDSDTGMYRPSSGTISFALNGVDSLILRNTGILEWFGKRIATEDFVLARLSTFTGGSGGGNTIINIDGNAVVGGNVTANIITNGIPTVLSLPQNGNYEGRMVYFNGDVWIFSCYPPGNGLGQLADPSIARLAGSDCRWTRFRGEGAVSVGTTKPTVGVEGQTFYESSTNTLWFYISGQWQTAAQVFTPNAPTGIDVRAGLPLTGNYEGRTVLNTTDGTLYIYRNGNFENMSQYISSTAAGSGILAGTTFPTGTSYGVGEIFRKSTSDSTGGEGLYVWDGANWVTLSSYTANTGSTAGIKTYPSLPTNPQSFNAGDLIIVNNVVYILNQAKTNWNLFTSNGVVTVSVTAGSIGTQQLAANAVTAAKIVAGTITGDKLVAGTITANLLATNSVVADKILANSITAGKIAAGAITAREIQANAITSNLIASGSIIAGKLGVGAVNAENIQVANLAVLSQNAGTITAGLLKSGDNKMIIDLNQKFIRIEL